MPVATVNSTFKILDLTTDKTKAKRFNSKDEAIEFGGKTVVKAGGLSKIVPVDGTFGEVQTTPQFSLEITGVKSKTVQEFSVPHYPLDLSIVADGGDVKVDADIVPLSKRL
jgi:hypothetical protein